MSESSSGRRSVHRVRVIRRRRGISLLEMLVVLTVAISISAATIQLMVLARDSQRNAKSNQLIRQEIRRFANDFRRDVHHADRVEVINGDLLVSMAGGTEQFAYLIESNSAITRGKTLHPDSLVVAFDRYELGQDASMAFDWSADSESARFIISESSRPDRPIKIIATMRSGK